MVYVYLLINTKNKPYIGVTNNVHRRLRQHNREIKGGAKKTRDGIPWKRLLYISGFSNRIEALQFEWAWQHPLKSKKTRQWIKKLKPKGKIGSIVRKRNELDILLVLYPHLTINNEVF